MTKHDDIRTNRELYLFVKGLPRTTRALEDYLAALRQLGSAHRDLDAIPLPSFARMLEEAMSAEAPPFDPRWAEEYRRESHTDYARWERAILDQIVDLHEMADAGTLQDEQRYFGIDAPRGARWYNFDPRGYLECAMAGTFGGWEPGDDGRVLVPGRVMVLDEQGYRDVDPNEIERPTIAMPAIDWAAFIDFLWAGQSYE